MIGELAAFFRSPSDDVPANAINTTLATNRESRFMVVFFLFWFRIRGSV